MNKTVLYLVLVVNFIVTGFFWWAGSSELFGLGGEGALKAFGRLFGLIGQLLILLELALVSRVPFIEKAISLDRRVQLHRFVGYGILSAFLMHPLLLSFGYDGGAGATNQFVSFILNWEDIFNALVALVIFIFVIIISIPVVRRKLRYDTWYFMHLLMYVALFLSFGHQTKSGDLVAGPALYYWLGLNFAVIGLFLAYRLLHPIYLYYQHRFVVDEVVAEGPNICSVYIKGQNLASFKYEAGQFASLIFLARGLWYHHPFSFSLPPGGDRLRFTMKALGDFTVQADKLKPGTKVLIDGPFGHFTTIFGYNTKYLLVAGGIGITPIRSLLEKLRKQNKDVKFIYGAKTEAELALKSEIDQLGASGEYVLSQEKKTGFGEGIIDLPKIKNLAPDFLERDIYICGPHLMTKNLRQSLALAGVPKNQIHFEEFSF
ncbi:MAG: hypothetical protein A2571_03140 [Candidatus Vogelbacteria bacterium RIFOXYD1_FULL_44_32]|uniref:FAD-binding FR-type domain-containing protein n=1 Tax=Candidatus Vogelbacteria bacterium RIFOXYD1_FULL_44_32 TaxID=1802438 RepID=A0A1G2QCL6_9BACT|nr:MAG: hypothetical protein A2571_03140 [Candidatus Vogelbacteria bacterium RIFOXYD1_FULL_44_32]